MAESCPVILLDGPFSMVQEGYNQSLLWAGQAWQLVEDALDDLEIVVIPEASGQANFTANNAWWRYVRPVKPTRPDLEFDPDANEIELPPSGELADITFYDAPTFNEVAPPTPQRQGPGDLTAVAPGDPPPITQPTMPTAPDIQLPEFPELNAITLPDAPTINLPTFNGTRPDFSGMQAPDGVLDFAQTDYQSELLDLAKARLAIMSAGGTGLPSAVAQAMRDRAYASQDVQETRAVQAAIEEYSGRGFDEPTGMLNKRIQIARQTAQNARANLNRDVYIRDQEIAIENLRWTLTTIVTLESKLLDAHYENMRIALDAAKTAVGIRIDVFNGQIAFVNLQLAAFTADAQVHRDLINAELAKIELYKGQLEGQRLVGQLNQQQVEIYTQRIRAVLSEVEIYNAQIAGARAQIEANNSILEGHRTRIQAYAERVRAYSAQWEAFGRQIEADGKTLDNYRIKADVFGTRVRAWAETNTSLLGQQRGRIDERKLEIDAWSARLERIRTQFQLELDRLTAETRIYATDGDIYRAEAGVEEVASQTHERLFNYGVEQERTRANIAIENLRSRRDYLIQSAGLKIEKAKARAQVSGQLTASAMSAVSISAGVSSTQSQSSGCSTSYSYAGEIATEA